MAGGRGASGGGGRICMGVDVKRNAPVTGRRANRISAPYSAIRSSFRSASTCANSSSNSCSASDVPAEILLICPCRILSCKLIGGGGEGNLMFGDTPACPVADRRRVSKIRRGDGYSGNALRDASALAVGRWLYL